ncbi:MAG: class I SAM-dependent methyltransferase [Halobacteriovoraceae bacterium]|nr:class I SAM-dependent methyltransferase [Halobacteriovoraceae bacterium]
MEKANAQSLKFDFVKRWHYLSRQNYAIRNQPLARALGLKNLAGKKVLDATCGSGKDSLLFLFFGLSVHAYERNLFLAQLIEDALQKGNADFVLGKVLREKFFFHRGDCREFSHEIIYDVIYYDPMYEEKRKTLPRKEMQIIKNIVKDDENHDCKAFFEWSIGKSRRLVVKRPLRGRTLFGNPHMTYKGKSTRYDVYLHR